MEHSSRPVSRGSSGAEGASFVTRPEEVSLDPSIEHEATAYYAKSAGDMPLGRVDGASGRLASELRGSAKHHPCGRKEGAEGAEVVSEVPQGAEEASGRIHSDSHATRFKRDETACSGPRLLAPWRSLTKAARQAGVVVDTCPGNISLLER